MAARPHLRNLSDQIDQLGGEDWVFDQIAAAMTMEDISNQFINPQTGEPYSRTMMYNWIHAGGEEREKKWKDAQKIASHIHVEDAGTILDNHRAVTSADVQLVKLRSEHRKYLAQKFNREVYGDDANKIDVHLSLGQLHLDALRSQSALPAPQKVLQAEVVEDDE